MIFPSHRNISLFLTNHQIKTRSNAGHGLWLMFLLPAALIVSVLSNPVTATATYKLSSIFSLGLLCSSLIFLHKSSHYKSQKISSVLLLATCCTMAVLFRVCLHRGLLFSCWSAIMSTIFYHKLYLVVLRKLPHCFTLGEGSICTQSLVLFLYFSTLNIYNNIIRTSTGVMQMATLTIQVGLLGLLTIIIVTYQFSIRSPVAFYAVTASVFICIVVLPLQMLLKMNPLLFIVNLFWEDLQRNKVLLYWGISSILAVIVVNRRIKKAQKANTSMRKVFHFLTLAVFLPGLLYNCSLLYLASGVTFGIFFMLEILRILEMPPLAEALQNGLVIFSDEKDQGIIALTPMYLLAGCAFPLWIHPAPCDVTNSSMFSLLTLLSGLLSVGVGDTTASIVGSKFGRFHWKGSKKTKEGTVASIVSQVLVIVTFVYFDLMKLSAVDYVITVSAVVVTSIMEAKTDQVDNLVLPIVMYTFLIV